MPDRSPPIATRPPGEAPVEPDGFENRFDLQGRSLRQHTARGTIINGAFQIGLAVLELVKRLVVVALLTASEFGFWGLLVVSLATLLWLKQVGIGDKYIQQSDPNQEVAFQKAFTLELLYTLIFYVLILAALPVYAFIYARPEIILPGFVLSLAVLASVFHTPTWIYYRRMQFVRQRTLDAVNPVVTALVTVGLAVAGASYWSLVIGSVTGSVVGAIVAVRMSPYRLRFRFDRGTLRDYVSFSWPLLIVSGSNLLTVQAAVLVGEWTVGLAGLGVIGLSGVITRFGDRVHDIVTRTLYPAIAAVRNRTELLFEAFVKSNRLALMWGMPFGLGLTLFAPDLVTYALGEKWRAAAPVLQAFGAILAAKQVGFNWTAFMRARGETRPLAVNGALSLGTFLIVGVPLMFIMGISGYVIGMAASTAVQIVSRTYFVRRLFAGFGIVRHALRAMAPSVPAVAAVLVMRAVETGPRTGGLVVVELALYALATVVATILLERRLIGEVIGYLRGGPQPLTGGGSSRPAAAP